MSNTTDEHEHDWFWMAESFQPNDDGETTTKRDYYECATPGCDATKSEDTQLPFVKRYARSGSNPIEASKYNE